MKKSYDEMVKSLRFCRTVTVVLIGLIIFIGLNNISTTKVANVYKDKYIRSEQSMQLKIETEKRKYQGRIDELESANEALISLCRPSVFSEVAKRTPLPKIKKA